MASGGGEDAARELIDTCAPIPVVAAAALVVAAPASAQVFIGADSGGAGVQLGPVGVGVGPRFSDDGYYHRRGYDANAYYNGECRLVRSSLESLNLFREVPC